MVNMRRAGLCQSLWRSIQLRTVQYHIWWKIWSPEVNLGLEPSAFNLQGFIVSTMTNSSLQLNQAKDFSILTAEWFKRNSFQWPDEFIGCFVKIVRSLQAGQLLLSSHCISSATSVNYFLNDDSSMTGPHNAGPSDWLKKGLHLPVFLIW